MDKRAYSTADQLILQMDRALRTLLPGSAHAARPSPAEQAAAPELETAVPDLNTAASGLNETERRHAAGLMRVNHTGEVCAQALYQGQALTARLEDVRQSMDEAAAEEIDHLAWCETRLRELDSHTSYLNPAWYAMSFGMGAAAGLAGDRWSLGFVAETEEQVCEHLRDHLQRLPEADTRSRAILEQMIVDEQQHGESARQAGGAELPLPVRTGMRLMSKVMKGLTYRV